VYAFWTQATSVIALAVSYSAVVTLLSPTAPIKPSSRMATMAATCSPKGDPSFGMATEVDHGYLVELQGDEVGQYPSRGCSGRCASCMPPESSRRAPTFDTSTSSLG